MQHRKNVMTLKHYLQDDRENIIRNNFIKDYFSKTISEMAKAGKSGAAQYQTNISATTIATQAIDRIEYNYKYEKQQTGTPDGIGITDKI